MNISKQQLNEFKDLLQKDRYYKVDTKNFAYAQPDDMNDKILKELYLKFRRDGSINNIMESSLPINVITG